LSAADEGDGRMLRDAEERLREATSALAALAAGVAHEVRNPLFAISATLDALEANIAVPEEIPQYIGVLRDQLQRLTDLTRDLLDYGKPPRINVQPASLRSAAALALEACGPLLGQRRVTAVNRVPEDLPQLRFDSGRVVQALRHLVEHAALQARPGARVEIEAEAGHREGTPGVECAVSDTGPGFGAEDLSRLFQPFYSRPRGATGLGLSIARRIVEEHGGRIVGASRPEGGNRISFFLPNVPPARTPC
jgi:signal transduction histidine kinase